MNSIPEKKYESEILNTNLNFRLFLQNQFLERCRRNPKYSLRAFAKFLEVDASTLSQILREKRSLSITLQRSFAQRLGVDPKEVENLPTTKTKKEKNVRELALDAFQVIADWYHYAIFELITVKGFKNDSKWIAKTLSISSTEVSIALERLVRLDLIKIDSSGKLTQGTPLVTTTGNPYTATAFRKLQHQVLGKASAALEEIPMELRDQSSMTFAINTKQLNEAKKRIKNFRRGLCDYLQKTKDRDAVYQLGISFYPVTNIKKGKKL
ncbi:MAG: TIGR02147 family protein [Bacteriovoracaceae bacterium]|nr:TIGR02147 family protein [Bacteriovoracaceae bacterium]